MSQITRCPSCATLFKVVPDQLRISDGWVRCGHCQEVFDATLSLQEAQAPVLSPGSSVPAEETLATTVEVVVASGLSAEAAPETAALSQGTGLFLQSEDVPLDAATPDVEQGLSEGLAAQDAAKKESVPADSPALLPEPDAALEAAEAFLPGLQQAGYGLTAALLADSEGEGEGEGDRATDPASNLLLVHPPLPLSAAPEESSAAPAATVGQSPFTPKLKAASLPEEQTVPETGRGFVTSPAAVPAEKTDGSINPRPWSESTANDANRMQATRSVSGEEFASETQALAEAPEPESVALLSDAPDEPSFVRSARRKALWHRPAVRAALSAAVLLLATTLVLQVALQQRHYLASAQPQWRSALEALCVPLRCELHPYQHIASVVVDASAFNKLRGDTYRFTLALKNQSAVPVALPAVELTLTDTSDQPLLRRVLTISELGAPAALPAGGEWSGSLEMDVALDGALDGDRPAQIAGYRVLAFYP